MHARRAAAGTGGRARGGGATGARPPHVGCALIGARARHGPSRIHICICHRRSPSSRSRRSARRGRSAPWSRSLRSTGARARARAPRLGNAARRSLRAPAACCCALGAERSRRSKRPPRAALWTPCPAAPSPRRRRVTTSARRRRRCSLSSRPRARPSRRSGRPPRRQRTPQRCARDCTRTRADAYCVRLVAGGWLRSAWRARVAGAAYAVPSRSEADGGDGDCTSPRFGRISAQIGSVSLLARVCSVSTDARVWAQC